MSTKTNSRRKRVRRGAVPLRTDEHPLMRVLVAQATRRGETLAALSKRLGVSYRRIAQWRRGEANIARARRPVLEAAARYLEVPTAVVLCMSGVIRLEDLMSPVIDTSQARFACDLERMKLSPNLAGLVPESLAAADRSVQAFVVLLWRELSKESDLDAGRIFRWVRAVELAAAGHAQARKELDALDSQATEGMSLF